MGQNKIIQSFFEDPNRIFGIREISRLVKIPKTTVSRQLNELVKKRMITKKDSGYIANESSSYFRLLKKLRFVEDVHRSGLLEYLDERFNPKSVILFGSFAKGEYNRASDIDIFVQSAEKDYSLSQFEKKLKHPINLFFEEKLSRLSDELFNNIINGIKLSGYIKIR